MSIYLSSVGDDDEKKMNAQQKQKSNVNFAEKEKSKKNSNQQNGQNGGKKSFNQQDPKIVEQLNNIKVYNENVKILEYKEFGEEINCGNREYKYVLDNLTDKRINKLATQMNFRLTEGNGECFYLIGVEDSGKATGLSQYDLDQSIKVLQLIASKIDAQLNLLNYRSGLIGNIGEIHITKEQKIKNKIEIKIGLIGEEQSGKSTLVGVLVTSKLDDGKGLASKNVFRHKHEVICGKTSSFTHQVSQ
jgi:GTPase